MRPDDCYLEVTTALWRRFLDVHPAEPIELVAFCNGRPWVAYATSEDDHVRLLAETESLRGFQGAYAIFNRLLPEVACRYEANRWSPAHNGRASDKEVTARRALFVDVDPVRPKGISATDQQLRESCEVGQRILDWLTTIVGHAALATGLSGNGRFVLVAIEPVEPTKEHAERVSRFLQLLDKRFASERVKVDVSVINAARLMAAPGTMKRKGANTPERPHRRVTFSCGGDVVRVPLEVLA